MGKRNAEIRQVAKESGVMLWQIAERYGLNDSNFSRKLRRELSESEKAKVIEIIKTIKAEQEASA